MPTECGGPAAGETLQTELDADGQVPVPSRGSRAVQEEAERLIQFVDPAGRLYIDRPRRSSPVPCGFTHNRATTLRHKGEVPHPVIPSASVRRNLRDCRV